MTKRRRVVLVSVTAIALLGVLFVPAVQWRLYGWWKGEAFFRGRPTSYYRPLCRLDNFLMSGTLTIDPYEGSWVQRLLGKQLTHRLFDNHNPLLDGDSASVPILLELLRDPDWEVRIAAARHLAQIQPAATEALPALRRLLEDWGDSDYYSPRTVEECIRVIEGNGVAK